MKTTLCTLLTLLSLTAGACSPRANSQPTDPATDDQQGGASDAQSKMRATLKASAVPKFDGARAWKDLETVVGFGPRPAGSHNLELLRAFITSELKAVGLTAKREAFTSSVPVTPYTPSGQLDFVNLYADMPGTGGAASPIVIVATHIDTKFMEDFVGANDGGSSTAAVLELARGFAATGPRAVTYRFLFLDGEEAVRTDWIDPDNTYGSKRHAINISKRPEFERLKAFVLLDMVADKDLRFATELYSTRWLQDIFVTEAKKAGLGKHVEGPVKEIKDDHLPFLELKVPSVDLIDLTYGPNNQYWHTSNDTLENCSQTSLDAAGQIARLGLLRLERRLILGK